MSPLAIKRLWLVWTAGTVGLVSVLAYRLTGEDKRIFVPAQMTDGHYQIELACTACHSSPFAGRDAMQAACEGCHLDTLKAARDSHPKSKFTDPRNADRTAMLDARYCTTCHAEHRPTATRAMGVTLPHDFCVLCHADIGEERPSHAELEFATCASGGCHNYHDNRALYEDFLLKHAGEPPLLETRALPERNFRDIAAYLDAYPKERFPLEALDLHAADGPADAAVTIDWATTAHAAAGVNCSACHENAAGEWRDRPGYDSCGTCHVNERATFLLGRHGMRLDAEALGVALPPMRPGDARLPMKDPPLADRVDCGSCHAPHRFDTEFAAVDACLGCHDDEHSRAYVGSPHSLIPRAANHERESPVTCATCHMPRVEQSYDWGAYVHVLVQHNQSDNLRPNEKMVRDVCMSCHGLEFTLSALADPELVRSNFRGSPRATVQSIALAEERRREIERQRQRERGAEPEFTQTGSPDAIH